MKVRIGRLAVLGYLVVALQAAAGGFPVPGYAAGPDLVLAVVVCVGLFAPPRTALVAAWLMGAGKDLTSSGPLGAWALLFTGTAGLVLLVREALFIERPLAQALLTAAVALPANLAYLAWRWAAGAAGVSWGRCVLAAFATSLLTAAVSPVVIWLVGRLRIGLGEAERTGNA